MKELIHPELKEARIECACGNVIETRSVRGGFKIDVCSACHPFFTGTQKLIDTEGRVDRFTKKFGAQTVEQRKTAAKAAKAALPAAIKAVDRAASKGVIKRGTASRSISRLTVAVQSLK